MNASLSSVALVAFALVGAQIEPREGDRLLPRKLRGLPVGILVLHHPNPVHPVREGGKVVWRHDTTVQSLVGDLRLVEFGAYVYTDAGWRLRTTMPPADFARAYRCPKAKLRKGVVYRNPDNARWGDRATAGDALWFFLAKDARGRLYKGTGLVETEGEGVVVPR